MARGGGVQSPLRRPPRAPAGPRAPVQAVLRHPLGSGAPSLRPPPPIHPRAGRIHSPPPGRMAHSLGGGFPFESGAFSQTARPPRGRCVRRGFRRLFRSSLPALAGRAALRLSGPIQADPPPGSVAWPAECPGSPTDGGPDGAPLALAPRGALPPSVARPAPKPPGVVSGIRGRSARCGAQCGPNGPPPPE